MGKKGRVQREDVLKVEMANDCPPYEEFASSTDIVSETLIIGPVGRPRRVKYLPPPLC